MKIEINFRIENNVTGISIRLRILKVRREHQDNALLAACYRHIDPFEDTESHVFFIGKSLGFGVTGISIRLRILKVGSEGSGDPTDLEVTGISIRLRILKAELSPMLSDCTVSSYRHIDPFEDTESAFAIIERVWNTTLQAYRSV